MKRETKTPHTPLIFKQLGFEIKPKHKHRINQCYLYNLCNLFGRAEELVEAADNVIEKVVDPDYVRVHHENMILSQVYSDIYISDVIHSAVPPYIVPESILLALSHIADSLSETSATPFLLGVVLVKPESAYKDVIEIEDVTSHRAGGWLTKHKIYHFDSAMEYVLSFDDLEEYALFLEENYLEILALSLVYNHKNSLVWQKELSEVPPLS